MNNSIEHWTAVSKFLQRHYGLNDIEAEKAIANYKVMLKKNKIGDMIYHAPIEETAKGIIEGGYS